MKGLIPKMTQAVDIFILRQDCVNAVILQFVFSIPFNHYV